MTLNPQSTAFVFPGQGSQFVGMGKELAAASPLAQKTFAEADSILGFKLSALCWEGPEADLNDTVNTQPALFVCSVAAWRALREKHGYFTPAFMAGHSLGEISALTLAGSISFADGLRLVRQRGEAMKAAGLKNPGGMAAILNLDTEALADACADACRETGGIVQIANDNCPGQVVISGDNIALEKAMELAKGRGARRAVRLPVSIAAHSPLMQPAVDEFTKAVLAIAVAAPGVPVVGNVTAAPLAGPDEIRRELPAQLTSPVRWTETIHYLLGHAVTTFVELGSKDVLTGLLKRISASATGLAVGTPEAIAAL